jgi:next-to-BRCA1 protein 1
MIIERYSDSASAFVVLDSSNMPVYKQLYRAAKAKSKLKLRVSVIPPQPKTSPRPVTVEDAPEASAPETYEPTEKITPTESDASPSTSDSATEMPTLSTAPSSITLLSGVELPLRPASPARPAPVETTAEETAETPVPESQPANFAQSAPFDPQTVYSSFQEYSDPVPAPAPAPVSAPESSLIITPAPFAVCCNNCEKTVADVHYHCQTCDDGDFDLCQACVDQAVSCYDENHWLIKRTMIDGQLVASSTEKIEPKAQAKKQEETPVQEESLPTPERDEYAVETTHIENAPEPTVCMPFVSEPLRTIDVAPAFSSRVPFVDPVGARWSCLGNMRTCNCCVQGMCIITN